MSIVHLPFSLPIFLPFFFFLPLFLPHFSSFLYSFRPFLLPSFLSSFTLFFLPFSSCLFSLSFPSCLFSLFIFFDSSLHSRAEINSFLIYHLPQLFSLLWNMKIINHGDQSKGMLYSSTVAPAPIRVPPAHASQSNYTAHINSHMSENAYNSTQNPMTSISDSVNPFGDSSSSRPQVPVSQAPLIRPKSFYKNVGGEENKNCNPEIDINNSDTTDFDWISKSRVGTLGPKTL